MSEAHAIAAPRAPAEAAPSPLIAYPERAQKEPGKADAILDALLGRVVAPLSRRRGRKLARIVAPVRKLAPELLNRPLPELIAGTRAAALDLRRSDLADEDAVARVFAHIRELSGQLLGGRRHHDVQLMGAFALLNGMIAEMATGEGKTLTAALGAATVAVAGIPVHVVTVNDYLTQRDAEEMGPLYRALGLSVGIVIAGQEFEERHAAYGSDIVYCTNKELAFDYLRDRMVLGQHSGNLRLRFEALAGGATRVERLRLRGLHFAIVNEADSVLIDEARTPLIISGQASGAVDEAVVRRALEVARGLKEGRHFVIIPDERRIALTGDGRGELAHIFAEAAQPWRSQVMREELIRQGLSALHLFFRDRQYLLRDDKLLIVNEHTGRTMKDRFWGDGLHQMIEAKEGVPLSVNRRTIARITYQRFFRRYRRLSGMTGTASQVAEELWSTYHLPVARIPTNKPILRKALPDRVFFSDDAKWRAIVARAAELAASGCPVLIGTRTVAASEAASARLTRAGLEHVVLNAAQDANEAAIVAEAGGKGRITVVTNMAGRGTDIKLAPGVAELGGLNVILSERHESRRIDDQLAGRSGRQGEPGAVQAFLSVADPMLSDEAPLWLRLAARSAILGGEGAGRLLLILAQRRIERLHQRMRRDLARSDRQLGKMLAFSGRPE